MNRKLRHHNGDVAKCKSELRDLKNGGQQVSCQSIEEERTWKQNAHLKLRRKRPRSLTLAATHRPRMSRSLSHA